MKITTKKRLEKALKIGAVVLAALVLLVLLVGVGASCIKDRYKNRELITCAAEETNATTEDTRTIYPSENLFDISKIVERDYLKVENDTVTVTNYYAAGTGLGLRHFCPKIVAGTYTFSVTITSSVPLTNAAASISLVSSSGVLFQLIRQLKLGYVTNTVTLTEEQLDMTLYFYGVGEGVVSWEKFTCNAGDTAYPYIPNLDGVRQDGYNNGYDIGRQDGNEKGYENGYEDGYGAGVEDSVFFGVSVTAALQKLDGSYEKAHTASPRKSSETFDFGFLTDYFKRNYTEGNYMACSLSLTFEKPVPYYTYLFTMHDLSGALAQLCTVVAEDGTEYTKFRFSRQEGKTGQLEYWGDNIEALKTLKIKQIKDIYLSFPLFDFSPFQYLSMTYKDVAYENGYAIGKQEGEDNAVFTFDNLKSGFFSILDAPFKAIKDALNFEFLGINISNLVLFLLTVIVVVIIIKKAVGK